MPEKNLDFDRVIDRRNTKSIKYDLAAKKGMPEDILPLWVADMDFQVSSYIQEAIIRQAEHGIFGYSNVGEEYFEIVKGWMKRRHGWDVEADWLVKTPGVVFALSLAVKAFTESGDSILIQQPVYYPFKRVIEANGRRTVSNTLIYKDNRYFMDFEDFEEKIVKEKIKLFILCNPHNPVGRVWTEEELIKVGDICQKHHVIVISDEIHGDFAFKGKHHVFAGIKKEYGEFTVTCTAPSKTFNLAGLQLSNIFISNPELKKAFCAQMDIVAYEETNVMGMVACEAAYKDGGEWYEAMLKYVEGNIAFTKEYVEKNIPGVTMAEHEGTYLVWLDFGQLGMSGEELEEMIVHKARLWLDSGTMFGESGAGFQRVNVACPRKILEEALERIKMAVLG
ncbi:MAG: pyridoxal phosphate-dependent aminotransferase [Kineothrix sp.]|nr:pyridoxal phosphate-dependent aminotransferase [Kineothrix sp.]NBI90201.1 pyridoxal phosphate-dependent aminotransferase [Lachnospiraceae bacterium]